MPPRLVIACLLVLGAARAHAQPALAIGKPLPAAELPDGTLVVKVIDGDIRTPVPSTPVWIDVDGAARTAPTDKDGRATFAKIPAGARIVASASRNSALVSDRFAMPAKGGVRVLISLSPMKPSPPVGSPDRALSGRVSKAGPRDTVDIAVSHDGAVPASVEVALVGYAADDRVSVQRVRTDARGHAKFTGLDASGAVAYYALAWLPRGRTGDRLAAMPILLDGTTGATADLVGLARDSAAPGLDDPNIVRVAAGKVSVTLAGVLSARMPVELYDAATRKKIATGEANDTAKEIVFDVAPGSGQVLYAEAVGDHGVRNRSLPFILAPDRGWATTVLLYPRLVPAPAFHVNADDQLLWGTVSYEVTNASWSPYAKKLTIPLPRGARGFALDAESSLRAARPIPPGVTELRGTFELPVVKGSFEWHLDLPDGAYKGSFHVAKEQDLAIDLAPGAKAAVTEVTDKAGRAYLALEDITIGPGGALDMKLKAPRPQPDGALFRACRKLSPDRTSALVGKPAPDFTLPSLAGGAPVKLSALRGKPVLINFMASWYSAGRELPTLAALAREVPAVSVVLLASDRDPDPVKHRLAGLPLTVALDKPPRDDDNIGAITHDAYGISLLPESYLVDKKGIVRLYIVNLREWDTPDAIACAKALAALP